MNVRVPSFPEHMPELLQRARVTVQVCVPMLPRGQVPSLRRHGEHEGLRMQLAPDPGGVHGARTTEVAVLGQLPATHVGHKLPCSAGPEHESGVTYVHSPTGVHAPHAVPSVLRVQPEIVVDVELPVHAPAAQVGVVVVSVRVPLSAHVLA